MARFSGLYEAIRLTIRRRRQASSANPNISTALPLERVDQILRPDVPRRIRNDISPVQFIPRASAGRLQFTVRRTKLRQFK